MSINYLYLDIETIPTQDAGVIADIAATITPPGSMKKAETIEKWEIEQKPQAVADAVAKTSFSGAMGHVCCVSWALNDQDPKYYNMRSIEDERSLLEGLFFNLAELDAHYTIVGHYVNGFDLRFLWQRAMVLGVPVNGTLPRDPKPWSDEVNDTMVMWAGTRDTISLDDLCKALGIPGKQDITGADVAGLWADGKHYVIANYCMDDVRLVRAAHQKMLVAIGG